MVTAFKQANTNESTVPSDLSVQRRILSVFIAFFSLFRYKANFNMYNGILSQLNKTEFLKTLITNLS